MKTKILLIRHAESKKNIKDIHGGSGEGLTEQGVLQAKKTVSSLLDMGINPSNSILIYPPNLQVVETAEIFKNMIGLRQEVIEEFKPLDLGIIGGLSNKEVKEKYPECFNLMNKWRSKEIEICDLTIPEMESPVAFFERGKIVLKKIQHGKYNIFICTNSLYILLLNILFGNLPVQGGGYKHFDIHNCGISLFEYNEKENRFILNKDTTNVDDVCNFLSKRSNLS